MASTSRQILKENKTMKKLAKNATTVMLTCLLAIPLSAGLSAAAEKLIVQDPSANNVFLVDDTGNIGFNISIPNYAADVVSAGAASKSQLHFSLTGNDTGGGYLTSVSDNNFFISSGAVYDATAGGWIQKSSDGSSVFFGSGAAGFRAYLQQGNTPGQAMTNVNQVMLIDYSGNMKMNGGVQMNNNATPLPQPACDAGTNGMLWLTKGNTDVLQICARKSGLFAWYPINF